MSARASLPPSAASAVDFERPLRFSFNGAVYTGFCGDTLASALLRNEDYVIARSFKYHRPRGVYSAGAEEPNAFVRVGNGARTEPIARATQVELYEGLSAESLNCWPSVRFDFGAVAGAFSRLLPAGFYYKTFMWPPRAWRFYERFIRRAAGIGRTPEDSDPDVYDKRFDHYDVVVVGAGASGIAAALTAGSAGARTLLVDDQAAFGGRLLSEPHTIDGRAGAQWLRECLAELAAMHEVRLLSRATVAGYFEHNYLTVDERVTDHLGPAAPRDLPRQRFWKVRAKQVVLATGGTERPLIFRNNDLPGIMLASAAQTYVNRYRVKPGSRAVFFVNNDHAYQAAADLAAAGIQIALIVDTRQEISELARAKANAADAQLMLNCAVAVAHGRNHVRAVEAGPISGDGQVAGATRTIKCDLLCVSGGWTPNVQLFSQSGGKLRYDASVNAFLPSEPTQKVLCAGAANGSFTLSQCLAEGFAVGHRASEALSAKVDRARTAPKGGPEAAGVAPLAGVLFSRNRLDGAKAFVDLQNDVTAADISLAIREGYQSIEHMKRYTTSGMGIDQGKTGNINAIALSAKDLNTSLPSVGTTTFRPPYSPVTFGAIVGRDVGALLRPVRHTPMHTWHVAARAEMEPVGLWLRPHHYPRGGEEIGGAVRRECMAVRNGVGIFDASTLGKIEIRGRDSVKFLNLVYTNAWDTLKVGACRYGVMLYENGTIFDDGVTGRLSEHHYIMTTTSSNADAVTRWLEEWLQCEWPHLEVYLTPVTEQWATVTLAGPNAREVLRHAGTDVPLDKAAFPFLSLRSGTVTGIPARIFRVSYTGENSYEINVPTRHGPALWEALLTAGQRWGITPIGTEAVHVLRAEKGYIAIGYETDGTVTPFDVGLDWLVSTSKPDFIGKRSLMLPHLRREDRWQLVGLATADPKRMLPTGTQIIGGERGAVSNPRALPTQGHVTSSYYSPTLDRAIAIALLERGRQRTGEDVAVLVGRQQIISTVVDPRLYDADGRRVRE